MNSGLKIKFDSVTGQCDIYNSEGVNLTEHFPFITDIKVDITSHELPKVVITCVCFDVLEFETDNANIEKKTVQLGYIKEKPKESIK